MSAGASARPHRPGGWLSGLRIDQPDPGTLRIRSYNRALVVAVLFIAVAGLGTPLALLAEQLAGNAPLANLQGRGALAWLAAGSALVLLAGIGAGSLWYWPVREEVRLSRMHGEGVRAAFNLFGRRRRARAFPLQGRVYAIATRLEKLDVLQVRLLDPQGDGHALDFDAVPLRPGRAATADYLALLAKFFGSRSPIRPITPAQWQAAQARARRRATATANEAFAGIAGRPAHDPASAAGTGGTSVRGNRPGERPPSRLPPIPALTWPLRLLVGGVGTFFAITALYNLAALIAGLGHGRIGVSHIRLRMTSVDTWSSSPGSFLFTLLIMLLELGLCIGVAYGCLRVAFKAPADKAD